MAKLSKKAKIEPVREANELAVENEYVEEVKENCEWCVADMIMADVKKQSIFNDGAGYGPKLSVDEIQAILNKYFA